MPSCSYTINFRVAQLGNNVNLVYEQSYTVTNHKQESHGYPISNLDKISILYESILIFKSFSISFRRKRHDSKYFNIVVM